MQSATGDQQRLCRLAVHLGKEGRRDHAGVDYGRSHRLRSSRISRQLPENR